MTDDLVKRLRRDLASEFAAIIDRSEEAADHIELLEGLVSYLAGTNKDHVRVMLAGNPIVCGEIIAKSLAALGENR